MMSQSGWTADPHVWEDLRKEARQLENEIDLKLVSYSKLAHTNENKFDSRSKREAEYGRGNERDRMFHSMGLEVEQLLMRLTEVNDKMAEFTNHLPNPSPSQVHHMQRHREILTDYSQEYKKTKANLSAYREREELLSSVQRDINSFKNASDYYLRENQQISNSHNLTEDTINIAIATQERLLHDRQSLMAMSGRLGAVFNRFPKLNNLIQRIGIRKRQNSLVIGGVTATCIILLLMYMFR
eukprot:Colp12_sorted_trinity150504_noHs@29220